MSLRVRRGAGARGYRRLSPTSAEDQSGGQNGNQSPPKGGAGALAPEPAPEPEIPEPPPPSPPPTPRCESMTVPFQTFLWLRDRRVNCDGVTIAAPPPALKSASGGGHHHHQSATSAAQQQMLLPRSLTESLIDGDGMAMLVEACQPRGALDYALPLNARKAKIDDDRLVRKAPALLSSKNTGIGSGNEEQPDQRTKEERREMHDVRRAKWDAIRTSLLTAADQVVHMFHGGVGGGGGGGAPVGASLGSSSPSLSMPSPTAALAASSPPLGSASSPPAHVAAAQLVATQDVFDRVVEQRDSNALAAVLISMHDLWKRKEQSRPTALTTTTAKKQQQQIDQHHMLFSNSSPPVKSTSSAKPPHQLPPLAATAPTTTGVVGAQQRTDDDATTASASNECHQPDGVNRTEGVGGEAGVDGNSSFSSSTPLHKKQHHSDRRRSSSSSGVPMMVPCADAECQTDPVHMVSPKEYAALRALLAATEKRDAAAAAADRNNVDNNNAQQQQEAQSSDSAALPSTAADAAASATEANEQPQPNAQHQPIHHASQDSTGPTETSAQP